MHRSQQPVHACYVTLQQTQSSKLTKLVSGGFTIIQYTGARIAEIALKQDNNFFEDKSVRNVSVLRCVRVAFDYFKLDSCYKTISFGGSRCTPPNGRVESEAGFVGLMARFRVFPVQQLF
jgi:hypothetical protein